MVIRFFPTIGELRSFFKDVLSDQVLSHLSVDPVLCEAFCRKLNLNPRDLLQREIRPDRLLESVISALPPVYHLPQGTPERIASILITRMNALGMDVLSGVFHVETRRLVIGPSEAGHKAIAEAAGWEPGGWTRIVFRRKEGVLYASFPPAAPVDAEEGFPILTNWLDPLFIGLPLK